MNRLTPARHEAELAKAETHLVSIGSGETELLDARLATESQPRGAALNPNDVHMFTLAAQVHWAAEGARLAIAHLLGAPAVPAPSDEGSFAELHRRLDETITSLREIAPGDLERGLDRTVVIENRRGAVSFRGEQFLLEYAIPHFYYHVTAAYGILRNRGVQLTMGDFLGSIGKS